MTAPFVIRQYFLPEADLTVSEWADRYRRLGTRSAAEAGPYRTDRTPYLRDIMNDLSSSSLIETVVFMKAAQIGASEMGNCWVGYIIDQAPGPCLIVQPTVDLAKRYSRQRIDSLVNETEQLEGKVAEAKSRDSA